MRHAFLVLAVLTTASPALPTPLIHEVFYDAEGADGPSVFTEIFGLPGEILDGWTLAGIDGSTGSVYRNVALDGAVVPHDGLLVIATARAVGDLLLARDFIADVDWQNGPDALQLRDPLGTIRDALQYGEAAGFFAGEGLAAVDVLAGFSLSRDGKSTDTGDNGRDFAVRVPTPGAAGASVPVSEPGTTLVLLASLALARIRVSSSSRRPYGRSRSRSRSRLSGSQPLSRGRMRHVGPPAPLRNSERSNPRTTTPRASRTSIASRFSASLARTSSGARQITFPVDGPLFSTQTTSNPRKKPAG
jgi:hypothetical protein